MTRAEKDARRAWVASLKVGDEVAVMATFRGNPHPDASPTLYVVFSVNETSATGGAVSILCRHHATVRDTAFDGDGAAVWGNSKIGIFPITQEIRNQWIARRVALRLSRELNWRNRLTVSQLLRIGAILDEAEGKEKT